jgi:hypothetical protein
VEARLQYMHATKNTQRISQEARQDFIPQPDGQFAVSKARRAEATALSEYRRMLGILMDLVFYGKIPPPDDEENPYF